MHNPIVGGPKEVADALEAMVRRAGLRWLRPLRHPRAWRLRGLRALRRPRAAAPRPVPQSVRRQRHCARISPRACKVSATACSALRERKIRRCATLSRSAGVDAYTIPSWAVRKKQRTRSSNGSRRLRATGLSFPPRMFPERTRTSCASLFQSCSAAAYFAKILPARHCGRIWACRCRGWTSGARCPRRRLELGWTDHGSFEHGPIGRRRQLQHDVLRRQILDLVHFQAEA